MNIKSMTIKFLTPGTLLFLLLISASPGVKGQTRDTLRQEVEVVKSYSPVTIDAEKIDEAPEIRDEEHKKPDFTYSIDGRPVFSALPVKNLQAATIIGKPKEQPGYGLVRAGVGNYNKPYGEIYFNNPQGRNSIFGIHARHLSAHSKLNLRNGDRVSAPFSENEAEIFLKHMFNKSTLSVNLGVDHEGFRYYGYPGTSRADSIPSFLKNKTQSYTYQGKRQAFTRGGISVNLRNIYATKEDPSAGFDFEYYRFGNKTGQNEDFAQLNIDFHRPRNGFGILLNAGAEYSRVTDVFTNALNKPDTFNIPSFGSRGQTWFKFNPALYVGNPTINLKAGVKGWIVAGKFDRVAVRFSPDIHFNFSPVKEIITLFARVDGNYYHNHYSAIAADNPFIVPSLTVKNHHEKWNVSGGFDGRLSSKINFKIEAGHAQISQQPLFYLQGFELPSLGSESLPAFADNTFRVLYDDMKKTRFNGELTYFAGDKLNILLSASIYKYKMEEQEQPWNLPTFDATASVSYSVNARLSVAADIYAIGNRKGFLLNSDKAPAEYYSWSTMQNLAPANSVEYKLNQVFDINIRGNYDITRNLSAFGQLNNFGMQKYERWLGYPLQTFNFLAGISFSF